jgi:hypothetical protein
MPFGWTRDEEQAVLVKQGKAAAKRASDTALWPDSIAKTAGKYLKTQVFKPRLTALNRA